MRPGWFDKDGAYHGVVCHTRYEIGTHYKSDFSSETKSSPRTMETNLEKLPFATKIRVPWEIYLRSTGLKTASRLSMKGVVRILLADGRESGAAKIVSDSRNNETVMPLRSPRRDDTESHYNIAKRSSGKAQGGTRR